MKLGNTLLKVWACALLMLAMSGNGWGEPFRPLELARGDYESVKRYLSELATSQMRKYKVTGMSIALVDDQQMVWAQGFGHAKENVPATPQTLYRAGSIAKLLTATAAMQLTDRGMLDIDKPLQDYLPEFHVQPRGGQGQITPRNIMTHHSGLARDHLAGMWAVQPAPFTELAAKLDADSAAYPPDMLYAYSNLGVTLLGHAIQNASGLPYAQYMQQEVLQPLGMTHSSFTTHSPDDATMSHGYRDGKPYAEAGLRDVPAGGLNTSAADLAHFLSMTFAEGSTNGRVILKPDSVHEMLRAQNENVALDANFHTGLGWVLGGLGNITIENAGPVAHHAGATLLFHSQIIALPEHKLGVVVLANSASAAPAVNKVATEAIKMALQVKTGIAPESPEKTGVGNHPADTRTMQEYVGDYATILGHVRVEQHSDRLLAYTSSTTFALEPRDDGLMGMRYMLFGVIPVGMGAEMERIGLLRRQVAGRAVVLAQAKGQQLLVGEKFEPQPIPPDWLQRLGEYEIINRGDDAPILERFQLKEEHGLLLCSLKLSTQPEAVLDIPLLSLTDETANVALLLHEFGETLRAVRVGNEQHLSFMGYELRNIKNH